MSTKNHRQLKLELDLKKNILNEKKIILDSYTDKLEILDASIENLDLQLANIRKNITNLMTTEYILEDLVEFRKVEKDMIKELDNAFTEATNIELQKNKLNAEIITLEYEIDLLTTEYNNEYNHWYAITHD